MTKHKPLRGARVAESFGDVEFGTVGELPFAPVVD
jgi:hypothetical protein